MVELIVEPRHAAVERVLDTVVIMRAAPLALAEPIDVVVNLSAVDERGRETAADRPVRRHDPELQRHVGKLDPARSACHRPFEVAVLNSNRISC